MVKYTYSLLILLVAMFWWQLPAYAKDSYIIAKIINTNEEALNSLNIELKAKVEPLFNVKAKNREGYNEHLKDFYMIKFPTAGVMSVAALDATAQRYRKIPGVTYAARDNVAHSTYTPNDTNYSSQWNMPATNADEVWNTPALRQSTVTIAVVDSGIDLDHPDIKANIWTNPGEIAGNKKDDDGNGYIDDVHGWDFMNNDNDPNDDFGHGSHVAGIIAASTDNANQVAGFLWTAPLMAVKVLDSLGGGTISSISLGITYAADNGALVSNYSLGDSIGDPVLKAAVDYARSLDVVQVAAAGNLATNSKFYPAAYDGVICTMSGDWPSSIKRSRWSNYGDWCDMIAPGDGILSLFQNGLTAVMTGTSQAAPHVSAVAAIVRTANPALDATSASLVVQQSADDLGNPGKDSEFQWGLANPVTAYNRAIGVNLSRSNASIGDAVDIYINVPKYPNYIYVVVPTEAGIEPGIDLSTIYPSFYQTIPVNYGVVTDVMIKYINSYFFSKFFGSLDGSGKATATLRIPDGNLFKGKTIHLSALILDPNNTDIPVAVLNSIALAVN